MRLMRVCAKLKGRVSGEAFSKHIFRAPMPFVSQKKHTLRSRNRGTSGSWRGTNKHMMDP